MNAPDATVAPTPQLPASQQTEAQQALLTDRIIHHVTTTGLYMANLVKLDFIINNLNCIGNVPVGIGAPHMSLSEGQLNSGSQYLLTVDCTGKVALAPISTHHVTPLPSDDTLGLSVNQEGIIFAPQPTPSTFNEVAGSQYLNRNEVHSHTTPSTSDGAPRRHVTPEEVVPHPRVAQNGPRITRSKNRGASRVLTNSPEIARIKETYDAKVFKKNGC